MTISELVAALENIKEAYGDLPCGGDSRDNWVRLTVCDEEGHDVEDGADYCGPAHSVYIEVS